MLLEIEADQGLSDAPDSLMDRLLVGVITSYRTFLLEDIQRYGNADTIFRR
jgi:hypothetical protein